MYLKSLRNKVNIYLNDRAESINQIYTSIIHFATEFSTKLFVLQANNTNFFLHMLIQGEVNTHIFHHKNHSPHQDQHK